MKKKEKTKLFLLFPIQRFQFAADLDFSCLHRSVGEVDALGNFAQRKVPDVVEEKAPLRRNVTTEEVGDVVSFLFSKMASAITGQIIYADNGYNIMGI